MYGCVLLLFLLLNTRNQVQVVVQSFSMISSTTTTRRSTLYDNDGKNVLGNLVECKTDNSYEVWISTSTIDEETTTEIRLPYSPETMNSLGGTLWPSCIAGSILLLHQCGGGPAQNKLTQDKTVLELGCGLGLGGMVAAAASGGGARKCTLSDNDVDLIKLLQKHLKEEIQNHDDDNHGAEMDAMVLDWRDSNPTVTEDDDDKQHYDVVMGFDVAYYYPQIAPIINTVRQQQQRKSTTSSGGGSILFVVGQANRESHWQLYHHIADGGYNQITDLHEPPWDGVTKMLLYKLEMGIWREQQEEVETNSDIEGVVPIAVLLHTTENIHVENLTPHDHIATKEDEESQMTSF